MVAFFKDDNNFHSTQKGVQKAILTLTYAAIILSISATISALTLTDHFGEIPSRASREPGINDAKAQSGSDWDILRRFRTRKSTLWLIYHCELTLARFCT